MTPQDAYWGAKRVMSFRNEDIRAIVDESQFSNSEVTGYITRVLIARRDLIGKAWFSRVAPFEDFTVAEGRLDYTDLGQKYGVLPASVYNYSWFSFDDESGSKSVVAADGSTKAVPPSLASLGEGSFIGCTLTDAKEPRKSVTAILRKQDNQWKLVGIERTSL
jgi:hypothetical protein